MKWQLCTLCYCVTLCIRWRWISCFYQGFSLCVNTKLSIFLHFMQWCWHIWRQPSRLWFRDEHGIEFDIMKKKQQQQKTCAYRVFYYFMLLKRKQRSKSFEYIHLIESFIRSLFLSVYESNNSFVEILYTWFIPLKCAYLLCPQQVILWAFYIDLFIVSTREKESEGTTSNGEREKTLCINTKTMWLGIKMRNFSNVSIYLSI